jgi:hypothetical protein
MKDVLQSLKSKRTWVRVVEISGWGNTGKKRFLFPGGGPIPEEDKLPMVICTIQIALIIGAIFLVALNIFSLLVNILLGIALLGILFLPSFLAKVYFSEK